MFQKKLEMIYQIQNLEQNNEAAKRLRKELKNLDNDMEWKQEMDRIYENCLEYDFTEISENKILERKDD